MPEIEHSVRIGAPVERVWAYVGKLPNWAPFMVGFQKLVEVDDRRSVWTLRGDVGILSREVDIQADITVWEPLRRVEFTVTGLTERITGEGSFLLERAAQTPSAAESSSAAATSPAAPRVALLRRLRSAVVRFFLRSVTGSPARRPAVAAGSAVAAGGAVAAGADGARLTFRLKVTPGGPMAPMLELLMAPMLEPAAEDLADGIRKALEEG
jgi:carbon monoxide dehydrogenase subunit G